MKEMKPYAAFTQMTPINIVSQVLLLFNMLFPSSMSLYMHFKVLSHWPPPQRKPELGDLSNCKMSALPLNCLN